MMRQKARAHPTKGGAGWPHSLAGQPGIGANEIMLSTRVMLSWYEEDLRWESQCGHETWPLGDPRWLTGLTSGPSEPHFHPKHQLNPQINTPYSSWQKVLRKCEFSLQSPSKFSSSRVEREVRF
jgi:hypothetical protein